MTPQQRLLHRTRSKNYRIHINSPIHVTVEEEYVGPLDLVPGAEAAYSSARALSADTLGENLYKIERSSDDTSQDFASDAVTGEWPAAAITAFLGGSNSNVLNWYDQSGNGLTLDNDHEILRMAYAAAQLNGKPGITPATNGFNMQTDGNLSFPNGGATYFIVGNSIVPFSEVALDGAYVDCIIFEGFAEHGISDATGNEAAGGDAEDEVPASGFHIWEGALSREVNSFKVDGGNITMNDDRAAGSAPIPPFTMQLEANFETGTVWLEWLIYPSVLTDPQRLAIRQNLATYYGITLS